MIRVLLVRIISMGATFALALLGQSGGSVAVDPATVDTGTGSSSSSAVSATDDTTSSSGSIPQNPDWELPSSISSSIPDDATMISATLVRLSSGAVRDIRTGRAAADADVTGTRRTQADPLEQGDGKRFIPVAVGSVRKAMAAAKSVSSSDRTAESTSGSVRQTALKNSEYGVYWGRYSGSQALFTASGTVFVQNAKGVVDVSQWQGTINWSKAKAAGVQGAIIRLSFGWGNGYDDHALANIKACLKLGIPFGLYMYSYAYDSTTAAAEGADVVSLLRKAGITASQLSYPIFYDLEDWTWSGHSHPTTASGYVPIVNAWYSKLQSAGYANLGVYSYTSYLDGPLNAPSIWSKVKWVAQYGRTNSFTGFSGSLRGWQYTSQGTVAGISGRVDLNAFGSAPAKGAVDATSYAAVSVSQGEYYIDSRLADSSSVDITNGSTSRGATTQLYAGNGTAAQRFVLVPQSGGGYVIRNSKSGLVLDVADARPYDGAVVRQYTANGTQAQTWFLRDSGSGYYLQSALGNWVLDISGASPRSKTSIRLYSPNGTDAQKFVLSSSSSPVRTDTEFRVITALDGSLSLDVPGSSCSSGTRMELYSSNTALAQSYRFETVGNGVYRIVNMNSNLALGVEGGSTANKAHVVQEAGDSRAQHWTVLTQSDGFATLVNMGSGKALDVPSGSAASLVRLQQYSVNGTQAQEWMLSTFTASRKALDSLAASHSHDLADGTYVLRTAINSSFAVDVRNSSSANGAEVRLWGANGAAAQKWRVSHDSHGYVALTNVGSGKVLDVANGWLSVGVDVRQWASNGSRAQKWIAVRNSDGTYTFLSALARGRALDVAGGHAAWGSNVWSYATNGALPQKWRLS